MKVQTIAVLIGVAPLGIAPNDATAEGVCAPNERIRDMKDTGRHSDCLNAIGKCASQPEGECEEGWGDTRCEQVSADEWEVVDDEYEAEEGMVCQPAERIIKVFNTDRHGDWKKWADTCGDAGADDEASCKEVNERCEWETIAQYGKVDEEFIGKIHVAIEDCKEFYTGDPRRLSASGKICVGVEECRKKLPEQLIACEASRSYKKFIDGATPDCSQWGYNIKGQTANYCE